MDSVKQQFLIIGSMMQVAKGLKTDPEKTLTMIENNKELYSWITPSVLKDLKESIEKKKEKESMLS